MQFMLIMTEPESEFAKRENPAAAPEYWGAWSAYVGALAQAGVIVHGDGLHPPHTATTVRIRDGKREVHDGPFVEAKEQLGGYFVIEVASLDEALDWAARSPSASYASVEIRPVLPPMPTN